MSAQPTKSARWPLVGIIVVFAVGSMTYRILKMEHLQQTSALFIGLPALLAILLAMTGPAKSATGVVFKGLTLLLLLSGILLGEGFICIVIAAPLFYLVGIGFGLGSLIGKLTEANTLFFAWIFEKMSPSPASMLAPPLPEVTL